MKWRVIYVACLLAPLASCGNFFNETDSVDAVKWCWPATGANGTQAPNTDIPITTVSGGTVVGCSWMCPADHAVMVNGEDGQYGSGPLFDRWQQIREVVSIAGGEHCEARVEAIEEGPNTASSNDDIVVHFNGIGDVTCKDAIDAEDPFLAGNPFPSSGGYWPVDQSLVTCGSVGGTAGGDSGTSGTSTGGSGSSTATPDGTTGAPVQGPELYGLSSFSDVLACTQSGKTISCSVDEDFVADVLSDTLLYYEDGALAKLATQNGVVGMSFVELPTSSIFYALGLREDDHVHRIDGFPVDSASAAVTVLSNASSDGLVSASFRRSTSIYTLSLRLTDLSTYP